MCSSRFLISPSYSFIKEDPLFTGLIDITYTTLHYTTVHYATLQYTTLQHTALHYATYTTPHYTTLYYNTLRYTTIHYSTLHYSTIHVEGVKCVFLYITSVNICQIKNVPNTSYRAYWDLYFICRFWISCNKNYDEVLFDWQIRTKIKFV
jgi:hypothetical protein